MQPSLGYTPAGANNRIDFREICLNKLFLPLLLSRNFSETLTEKGRSHAEEEATQVKWTRQNSEKTAHVTSTLIVLDFPGKLHLQRTEDVESI